MKKILMLLAIAILPACNSTQTTQGITEIPKQEVKAQSNQGVNSYIGIISKLHFDSVDKNKDGFITKDEYGNSSDFDTTDTNKDGKISLDEYTKFADGHYISKELLRKDLVEFVNHYIGNNIFTANYSGFMTKDQFITLTTKVTMTKEPVAVFYMADKNNDGKLSFSEFEDCSYALGKASIDSNTNSNKSNN